MSRYSPIPAKQKFLDIKKNHVPIRSPAKGGGIMAFEDIEERDEEL
jgi:hypothetical protein